MFYSISLLQSKSTPTLLKMALIVCAFSFIEVYFSHAYAAPNKEETFSYIKERISTNIKNIEGYCLIKEINKHEHPQFKETREYIFNLSDIDPSYITLEYPDGDRFGRISIYTKEGKKLINKKYIIIGSNSNFESAKYNIEVYFDKEFSKDKVGITDSSGSPYIKGSAKDNTITFEISENVKLNSPKVKKALEHLIRSCGGTNDLF